MAFPPNVYRTVGMRIGGKNEQVQSVLNKFDKSQSWMLPVVSKEGAYLGFISKSRILMAYREHLINISQ